MKNMIPGSRQHPPARRDDGILPPDTTTRDDDLDRRVSRLENDFQYIRRDLDEIRGDTRAIKEQLCSLGAGSIVLSQSMDARFTAANQKMDAGFAAFNEKMDAGFAAFNEKMDAGFATIHQRLSTVPTKLRLALLALTGMALILGSALAVVAVLLRSTGHADVANVLDAARG